MDLASRQIEDHLVAKCIYHSMDFRRRSTSGFPDVLIFFFFLAPQACWCAWTVEESSMSHSPFTSSWSEVSFFWKTPFLHHRLNRVYTKAPRTKFFWQVAPGYPVLHFQSIPSSIRRWSFLGRDLRPFSWKSSLELWSMPPIKSYCSLMSRNFENTP